MDNIIIRSMKEEDSSEVLEMMKVFYASPALLSDPSEDVKGILQIVLEIIHL